MTATPRLAFAALALAIVCGAAAPAAAQTVQRAPEARDGQHGPAGKGVKPREPEVRPAPKGTGPSAQAPAARRSPSANPSRLPQTAEAKAKRLSDLYAQLQAADGEEAAKRISEQIERLWQHSGSDTVNLLMQRSTKAVNDKNPDLAQKLLDRVVELAPDYAEGFNQRAFFHYTQNNYEAAVGDLRRTLALDPNHYKAMEGLVQIWRDTGNKRGAFKVLQQLLEVHPFAAGARQIHDELKKEVEGQGI
jgi:tetratricopeptide (TPR) repeat protein